MKALEKQQARRETNLYSMELDAQHGIVRVRSGGFWTVEAVEEYTAALVESMSQCRKHYGRAKVLVDTGSSPVQSKDVSNAFVKLYEIYKSADAFAVVVETTLLKMQAERTLTGPSFGFFLSSNAAEDWIKTA